MILELSQLEEILKDAQSYQRQGNLPLALEAYEKILSAQPNNAGVLTQLAIINLQLKNNAEAKIKVESALKQNPNNVSVLNIAAVIYQNNAQTEKALDCYTLASNLDPNNGSVRNNLGQLQLALGNLNSAEDELTKAIKLAPQLPEAWSNLGSVYKAKGDFGKAIEYQQRAIQLKPNFADAHYNLGNALKEIGKYDEAVEAYQHCLTISPSHKGALSGLGLIRLVQGDYSTGLPLFEHRLELDTQLKAPQPTHLIKWQGESIPNGEILVTHEQGLGDQIHCVRFATTLRDMGYKVFWQTPSVLKALFASTLNSSGVQWIRESEIPDSVTHYVPLMSLFGCLKIDPIRHQPEPYLLCGALNEGENPRPQANKKLKVGLCWQGNPDNPTDYKRSIPWSVLSQLLSLEEVEFVSLQKDENSDTNATTKHPNFSEVEIKSSKDFYDTAQLIKNLDLVISVDTAVLHLTGAIEVPCWGLLAYINDWRWALERKDTSWYKRMVLYRQNSEREWDSVIKQVMEDLRNKLN